jgi:hypothetical protein
MNFLEKLFHALDTIKTEIKESRNPANTRLTYFPDIYGQHFVYKNGSGLGS